MKTQIRRFLSVALAIAMIFSITSTSAFAAEETDFKEGTYTGTYNKTAMSGVGIVYTISAAFADGNYSYDVVVELTNGEYNAADDTKTGTYTIEDGKLVFTDGNLESAEMTDNGLRVYGTLSSFAFAADYADLAWTSADGPSGDSGEDEEESKTYAVSSGAYEDYSYGESADYTIVCEGACENFTEVQIDGVMLDEANYTAISGNGTTLVISGEYLKTLNVGRHSVVLVYTDGESEKAVLHVAEAEGTYADELESGNYELDLDDFSENAGVHRHPCIITIDREAETFIIHDKDDAETNKGSGTISFDSSTGEYIMTYTAGGPETQDDPTTIFVLDGENLKFTSPLKLGRSMMNTRNNDGSFISYTAKRVTETEEFPFTDVSEGSWYYTWVKQAYEANYMAGVSATEFDPEGTLTRAQMVQILYNIEGAPEVEGTMKYTDTKAGSWYENAIIWATENNVVAGYEDNTFKPTKNVTREELAQMIYNYVQYKNLTAEETADGIDSYSDASKVSSWAKTAVDFVTKTGIMSGTSTTKKVFDPKSNTTRAMAAVIAVKLGAESQTEI